MYKKSFENFIVMYYSFNSLYNSYCDLMFYRNNYINCNLLNMQVMYNKLTILQTILEPGYYSLFVHNIYSYRCHNSNILNYLRQTYTNSFFINLNTQILKRVCVVSFFYFLFFIYSFFTVFFVTEFIKTITFYLCINVYSIFFSFFKVYEIIKR